MYNKNRGYIGASRSVRSFESIESYEVPKSHITMNLINECANDEQLKKIKQLTLSVFKEWISPSSWHHTGSYFNETDHFDLISSLLELEALTDEQITQIKDKFKNTHQKKKNDNIEYGVAEVQIWGGSRNRPKLIGTEVVTGTIKGDWLITPKSKRFKLSANKTLRFDKSTTLTEIKKITKDAYNIKKLKKDFM